MSTCKYYAVQTVKAHQQMPTFIKNAKIACLDFNLNKFSNISEINDQLLENIDICIDKIKKIRTDQENPFKLERDEQIK